MRTATPKNRLHVFPVGIVLLALPLTACSGCAWFEDARSQESTPPTPSPQEIVQPTEVRALPGKLDDVPVFNSNSPEWVRTEGILLSTFPPTDKLVSAAHLNFPLQGRFDLFVQHYIHAPRKSPTLYLGVIVHNPSQQSVTVEVLQAASYLLQETPRRELPFYADSLGNTVYSGPGDRAVGDVLLGKRLADFPDKLVIPPGSTQMLMNQPMPVRYLRPPINGRSSFMRLRSSGKVYVASLAMFALKNLDGYEQSPTLEAWLDLLKKGGLAGPRTLTPTPPQATSGQLIYGQVAGISSGSHWQAQLVDHPGAKDFTISPPGQAVSYTLSTLRGGQLGTGQVQAARMLVRYPDTAYQAHGNYAVEYNLSLPLHNATDKPQIVSLTLETPLKEDQLSQKGLRFQKPPKNSAYFSGTVRLRYPDDLGQQKIYYVHLWHQAGQVLEPLKTIAMPPGSRKALQVDLIYPPDSTPPQVLTIRTQGSN